MTIAEINWDRVRRITLGVPGVLVSEMMDEWLYRGAPCQLLVRRAKTHGLIALTISVDGMNSRAGVVFCAWCIKRSGYNCKLSIEEI